MTTPKIVLGVSGVCRVGFGYPTQFQSFVYAGFRQLCLVCWVCHRVRACMTLFALKTTDEFFLMRGQKNPTNPTHSTQS